MANSYDEEMRQLQARYPSTQPPKPAVVEPTDPELLRRYPTHAAQQAQRQADEIAVPPGVDRDRVIDELRGQGIGTADYVPCVHLQPYMREAYGFTEGTCPVAEDVASRTLSLPFFPQLEAGDQERVVDALRAALA